MSRGQTRFELNPDELRRNRRFHSRNEWQAFFAANPVTVIDISESGLQVEHTYPIAIGKEGQVTLALRTASTISVPARIVWSRFGKGSSGNQKVYRSGLVFDARRGGVSEDLLELLVRSDAIRVDSESLEKKQLARALKAQRRMALSSPATSTSAAA